MNKVKNALELALGALKNSVDLVSNEAREAESLYGKYLSRLARVQGLVALEVAHQTAIKACEEALNHSEENLDMVKQEHGEPVGRVARMLGMTVGRLTKEVPIGTQLYTAAQPAPVQAEPVAVVTGIYGGRFTYAPFKASVILPVGMTFYSSPQQRKPLTNKQLFEHWQVAKVSDMTHAEIDIADYVLIARDVEALHNIKE